MAINFLQSLSSDNVKVSEALKARVRAGLAKPLTAQQLETLSKRYLVQTRKALTPSVLPGVVISSLPYQNMVNDQILTHTLVSTSLDNLSKSIEAYRQESKALILDMHKSLINLENLIKEQEIKIKTNFNKVYFNSFVSSRDFGSQFKSILTDPKTGMGLGKEDRMKPISSGGLTLPIFSNEKAFVEQIYLVGDESSFGDNGTVLISSPVENIVAKNKLFRHVVLHKSIDSNGVLYSRHPAAITIELVFANFTFINYLNLSLSNVTDTLVRDITIYNDAQEPLVLDFEKIQNKSEVGLIFEPVFTNKMRFTLESKTAIESSAYLTEDIVKSELNKILAGSGFEGRFALVNESLTGYVYDISVRDVTVGLKTYRDLGYFISKNYSFNNLKAVDFVLKSRNALATSLLNGTDENLALEDVVLNDSYMLLKTYDANDNLLFEGTLPLPSGKTYEVEYLPLTGTESSLKFFPNFWDGLPRYELVSTSASSVAVDGKYDILLTTKSFHELTIGSIVNIFLKSKRGHFLNGLKEATVLDETTLKVTSNTYSASNSLSVDELHKSFFYLESDLSTYEPVEVYENNTKLTCSIDYNFQIKNKLLSNWPITSNAIHFLDEVSSNECNIVFTNPKAESIYWCKYKKKSNQKLEGSNHVLKNGIVLLEDNSFSIINVIVIARTNNTNPQATHIIDSYCLKGIEHVA